MRDKVLVVSFCILLCLSALPGCGYRFKEAGRPVGVDLRSLAIPLIPSTSTSLGFEGDFTRALREEFVSHARIPLLPVSEAQAVLRGRVYEIKTEPLSYELTQSPVQGGLATYETTNTRRLKVRLEARLVDTATGNVIWEDRAMEEKATYAIGTDPLTNRYNRRQALQKIAGTLAAKIYSKTMERF